MIGPVRISISISVRHLFQAIIALVGSAYARGVSIVASGSNAECCDVVIPVMLH